MCEPRRLAKPQLVGLHMSQTIKHMGIGLALATLGGFLVKQIDMNPRKHKYELFYRYYDPIASFEKMRKAGCFQSCPVEKEDPPAKKK